MTRTLPSRSKGQVHREVGAYFGGLPHSLLLDATCIMILFPILILLLLPVRCTLINSGVQIMGGVTFTCYFFLNSLLTSESTNVNNTVYPLTEAPASVSTNNFDHRPVSGTRLLSGTRTISKHATRCSRLVNFTSPSLPRISATLTDN